MSCGSIRLPILALVALACGQSPTAQAKAEYRDPLGRFSFSYTSSFGLVSVGTNDGFGNRAAAFRFSTFSPAGIGGEAVLSQNRLSLDVQAAGGLYDDIVSEALPEPLMRMVNEALLPLTRNNLCDQLGRERHLDLNAPPFSSLTAAQRNGLAILDSMGNVAPMITRCSVTGDTVTFEKEAGFAGGARRRTVGVVRFLAGRYVAFQLIRAGTPPPPGVVAEMEGLVNSLRLQ